MAKILIVDDSPVMRRNLNSVFSKNGHEVVGEAVDGKQAIISYINLKPDLVTMDITMPKVSGVEAVKEIIKNDSNAKIIMLSALNQKNMVFEALKNGAKHYIIKPIDPNNLLEVVNEVLKEKPKIVDETKEDIIESNKSQNDNIYKDIEKLAELRDKGILTEDEFNEKKQLLLDKIQ